MSVHQSISVNGGGCKLGIALDKKEVINQEKIEFTSDMAPEKFHVV
jgi:hypothetical protein